MSAPTSDDGRDGARHDGDPAALRRALAGLSGTDPADWHLVGKVQHALLVVLRAVARQSGPGEAVVQPFAPVSALAPVVSAGLRPSWADVDRDTLSMDPATVPRALTPTTRALVARHTFGPAAPLARLRGFLPQDVLLVEDSSHCLGHLARGEDGEPVADVSVHDLGHALTLPTRSGAAVWVDPALRGGPWHRVLSAALATLPPAGRRKAVAGAVGAPVLRAARRLGAAGSRALTLAASTGLLDLALLPSERAGRVAGEPTLLPTAVLEETLHHLPRTEEWTAHRRSTAAVYRDGLAGLTGITVPRLLEDPKLALVRYPVLLDGPDRAGAVVAALRSEGVPADRWYSPTLFPGPTDPAAFSYDPSGSPVAEDVSRRVVTLQTAPFVTAGAAARAVQVVRSHL
ncbi:DegT/DnrJ/EryC1/StrS family aminotransferase [Ornithinimicrobium avium]|uniref:DegT/DnrJ/EryC1/StrS family aminotransferase n=1 Tax=Ornithinimicrobium avium TaxID=2283195 RepID=UPI0013B362D0|nr:DegT/DnrJ/EryC1/StrS family aminotransferase [Ornithinimicrobium avium]